MLSLRLVFSVQKQLESRQAQSLLPGCASTCAQAVHCSGGGTARCPVYRYWCACMSSACGMSIPSACGMTFPMRKGYCSGNFRDCCGSKLTKPVPLIRTIKVAFSGGLGGFLQSSAPLRVTRLVHRRIRFNRAPLFAISR